jgi:hypothetical protein
MWVKTPGLATLGLNFSTKQTGSAISVYSVNSTMQEDWDHGVRAFHRFFTVALPHLEDCSYANDAMVMPFVCWLVGFGGDVSNIATCPRKMLRRILWRRFVSCNIRRVSTHGKLVYPSNSPTRSYNVRHDLQASAG